MFGKKPKYTTLFSYFALLALSLLIIGCERKQPLEEIDFNDTVELKKQSQLQKPEISICVGSMITPEEGYALYKKLFDYIGQELDMRVKFVEKNTYSEVNAHLKSGDIDVAFVCGGPYVEGRDEFGLELLCAPVVEGKTVYYSYIIVKRNSGIEKLDGLRGKKFAFVDPLSNTGKLAPIYMLQELGETPQSFFSEYLYTYKHDNSIKAVAEGIVDGAAVDSLIWEYMNKKASKYSKETKIIMVSKAYAIPPVVVRPGLNTGLKIKIKNILLNMDKKKEGKEILQEMFIDKFVLIDDSDYDTIREIKPRLKK